MKKATLLFNNIRLNPSQTHKLRGYLGNVFKDYDLIHNHNPKTGKLIYRYPLIQFKIMDKTPCLIALTEMGVKIFTEIFMKLEEIIIEGKSIPVHEKNLKIENVDFGFSKETYIYRFMTPWLGLNQKNYAAYSGFKERTEKDLLLQKILTGNILSLSKDLGVFLDKDQRIHNRADLQETRANLKGKKMIGFKGIFKANFIIPDDLGIGKSVSRGYGSIRRVI